MSKSKTPAKKPTQKTEDENSEDTQEGNEGEGDGDEGDGQDENQRINAIVTSRVKREMKSVLAQLSTLTEAIGKLSTPKKDEETDEDETEGDEAKKPEAKPDLKIQRQMTRMQNELKEEREARKKAEQAQKDEYAKNQRQEMVSVFEAALTEHGVTDPKLRRAALRDLEAEGFMIRDEESGKIKFKGTDKFGMETMYDPKAGVKQWVLTEGKSFVPAVDAGGSGTGGTQKVGNTNLTRGEFNKLPDQQKAAINLERACSGLPPLE